MKRNREPNNSCRTRSDSLPFYTFADITEGFLYFTGDLFSGAFGLLTAITCGPANALLYFSYSILDAAFYLIAIHVTLH